MSPAVKYTLGRLGLFVLLFVVALPLPLNIFVKAMVALVLSAVLSYFLLADWRNQMGEQLAGAAGRRAHEKERLRAALAGDEDAAAAGDRATDTTAADQAIDTAAGDRATDTTATDTTAAERATNIAADKSADADHK